MKGNEEVFYELSANERRMYKSNKIHTKTGFFGSLPFFFLFNIKRREKEFQLNRITLLNILNQFKQRVSRARYFLIFSITCI